MNPFERGIRTVDAWQQRHRVPAFTFAVFKKFGDDQLMTSNWPSSGRPSSSLTVATLAIWEMFANTMLSNHRRDPFSS